MSVFFEKRIRFSPLFRANSALILAEVPGVAWDKK
jgi:hypothetical protein